MWHYEKLGMDFLKCVSPKWTFYSISSCSFWSILMFWLQYWGRSRMLARWRHRRHRLFLYTEVDKGDREGTSCVWIKFLSKDLCVRSGVRRQQAACRFEPVSRPLHWQSKDLDVSCQTMSNLSTLQTRFLTLAQKLPSNPPFPIREHVTTGWLPSSRQKQRRTATPQALWIALASQLWPF